MDFLRRHWRGELSLPISYWVNGSIIGMLITGASTVIEQQTDFYDSVVFSLFTVIFILVYTVWALVGIWRSAGTYIFTRSLAHPAKSGLWGYVAKVMVIIGAIRFVVEFLPVALDGIETAKQMDAPINTQFYIQHVGDTDIMLTGYINEASVAAIMKEFDDPERIALIMESPGGLLASAIELAEFVKSRSIVTIATEECASGCLLVLASGKDRIVTPGTNIAFHHPEDTFTPSSEAFREMGEQDEAKYYELFESIGVPQDTLSDLRRKGWYDLSIAEAYKAHLVDHVWDIESGDVWQIEAWCESNDCSSKVTTDTEID